MIKGQLLNKTNKEGKKLYFIGYSRMLYQGKPLMICGTDLENKNTYGQYPESFFKEA